MRLKLLATALFLAIALPTLVHAQSVQTTRPWSGPVVDFSVAAAVQAEPNRAIFSVGVNARGASAAGALTENARRMTAVVAALRAAGVEPSDLQTTSVVVERTLDRSGQFSGYTANNSVTVSASQSAQTGALIDAAFTAGADRMFSLRLSIADPQPLARQARVRALQEAQAKAMEFATASGFRSVRLISFVERGVRVVSRSDWPDEIAVSGTRVDPYPRPGPSTPLLGGQVNVIVEMAASYEMVR